MFKSAVSARIMSTLALSSSDSPPVEKPDATGDDRLNFNVQFGGTQWQGWCKRVFTMMPILLCCLVIVKVTHQKNPSSHTYIVQLGIYSKSRIMRTLSRSALNSTEFRGTVDVYSTVHKQIHVCLGRIMQVGSSSNLDSLNWSF